MAPPTRVARPGRPWSLATAQPRSGSIAGLSDWERWLEELYAPGWTASRVISSIHSGGMLITAAPLIDIAPLERG